MKKTIAIVCGTRPEIIKMSPVYRALLEEGIFNVKLIHSGQHEDMAEPFYRLFGMNIDVSITLNRADCSDLSSLSARLLEKLSKALNTLSPDVVLVHGDTSTSAMAALASFYHKIPVGHVEAGLRTHNLYSPFPEELNRSLISKIAQWHFAPTAEACANLFKEGIDDKTLFITGNTVIDAALSTKARIEQCKDKTAFEHYIDDAHSSHKKLVVVTTHRRENWNGGIANIAQAVGELARKHSDVVFIWPVHANAIVRNAVDESLASYQDVKEQIMLTQPIGYEEMIWALSHAWLILTDSGGLQEEATAFKTPVLVLRESTERPELIASGGGVLVGTDKSLIMSSFETLYTSKECYEQMSNIGFPFGNGTAALTISEILTDSYKND